MSQTNVAVVRFHGNREILFPSCDQLLGNFKTDLPSRPWQNCQLPKAKENSLHADAVETRNVVCGRAVCGQTVLLETAAKFSDAHTLKFINADYTSLPISLFFIAESADKIEMHYWR